MEAIKRELADSEERIITCRVCVCSSYGSSLRDEIWVDTNPNRLREEVSIHRESLVKEGWCVSTHFVEFEEKNGGILVIEKEEVEYEDQYNFPVSVTQGYLHRSMYDPPGEPHKQNPEVFSIRDLIEWVNNSSANKFVLPRYPREYVTKYFDENDEY